MSVNIVATEQYVQDVTKNKIDKPSTGNVGQVLVVKSVDNTGAPTEFEAKDAPSSLPKVSSSDNGKVLQVVDGSWSAVEVVDGNTVLFYADGNGEVY